MEFLWFSLETHALIRRQCIDKVDQRIKVLKMQNHVSATELIPTIVTILPYEFFPGLDAYNARPGPQPSGPIEMTMAVTLK